MSWKGFQKAVNRLPYQILSKKSEATRDAEYIQLEKQFNDLSKIVGVLAKDARIFRDSVSVLLSNQAAMAEYLAVIYDASLGTQAPEGTVQKRFQQTPAQQLQAVNDAEAAMVYCRDEVLPELDVVDRNIIRPLLELEEIMKLISKTMTKRNHKLIDYDRHRLALQKLNNKQERSFSEEKQIFKVQSQLETATQDYNYLNDMLKQELPRFFQLKAQFIHPVFENLYNMQSRIYGIIYARCYELLNQNLGSFVTNTMGIEEGYNYRKSQRDVRSEYENLDLLKSGGKAWLAVSGGTNHSKLSLQERAALKRAEAATAGGSPVMDMYTTTTSAATAPLPPPAYGQSGNDVTLDSTPISYGKQQQPSYQQQQQPPSYQGQPSYQQPQAYPPTSQFVVALYDYTAQAEGDLSFKKDDKIEVLERTPDTNDWWKGRLNGVIGVFPGNYVAEI
ncbi:uncharacterized protein BX663DRAFT_522875 [Cokeromyces recurvatus]|uniref:uncharacterized protein n=1 Tax=Cokeromyces recurvatus TaxID=90255 RepID=UPI00221EB692|nr:uncharacterized protein BX663DRAFT_522875 [Cokeromyces recurvatus]KAI7899026.1 hypothetical protein BX663DRAFT_522875 [Cokeromyces recurvatus]